MLRTLVLLLAVVSCGGKTGVYKNDYAGSITLTLVNGSPRPIEAIYIFPMGSQHRGTSWTSLAAGASSTVKIREGNFQLVAVSARRRIDTKFTEVPEATTMLEVRANQTLVFHDDGQPAPGLGAKDALPVTFMLGESDEPPPAPTDTNPDPLTGGSTVSPH
jgi:hypothetical protein